MGQQEEDNIGVVKKFYEYLANGDRDGAYANIIADDWVPDLIIADYRLRDEKTGDMAIRQVREEVNMDVPAMIITGDTSPARLREATASGFPLLHKPVIAEDLYKAITRLVGDRT